MGYLVPHIEERGVAECKGQLAYLVIDLAELRAYGADDLVLFLFGHL